VYIFDAVVLPDSKILATGVLGPTGPGVRLLARFNPNGSTDTTFTPALPNLGNVPRSLTVQDDGRILIGVHSGGPDGWYKGLIRIHPDGNHDRTFAKGPGTDSEVTALAKVNASQVVIVGTFTKVNGKSRIGAARVSINANNLTDYDGDGRADLSVRRPSDNIWYLLRGTAGFTALEYGVVGDRMAPADYDGDGKTDVAVFRPSEGKWYMHMSQSQTFQVYNWGQEGDLPVPTDRDADGATDLVIFRPSNNTWYTRYANGTFNWFEFGEVGDKPVRGDFDGDGVGDVALYRPSNNNW